MCIARDHSHTNIWWCGWVLCVCMAFVFISHMQFIDVKGKKEYAPTIFGLWRVPNLIKQVFIPSQVSTLHTPQPFNHAPPPPPQPLLYE